MAGQIIARGENTWVVRVFMGRDANGKRRYHNKTVHGTKKDAQKYLNGALREKDLGTFVEPARFTVGEYLDRWLADAAQPRLRARTYVEYENLLKRYVRPVLSERRLSDVTSLDIQALYAGMLGRKLSARTVRYTHAVLSSALKQAVKWGLLGRNPADNVDLPRQQRQEMQALSPEQAERFRKAAAESRFGILFDFALATGMRPGEYLGLQWSDVDLKTGIVRVQRALSRTKKGTWHLAEPKTARARRSIPLPPSVLRALVTHKARQAEIQLSAGTTWQNHGLVFCTDHGEPLDERNLVVRHFKPILKAAKLSKAIRLYDLRHTCATLLLAAGENPKVVSERLGHASITLTLDTYSHVLPTMQQGAADRLEAMLFGR